MDTQLTIDAISTCDQFFSQVSQLQVEQLKRRATQELDDLSELDTKNVQQELHRNMNQLVLQDGFDSLLVTSEQLKRLDPSNVSARFLKAYAHEQLRQFDEAITELLELNELSGTTNYNVSIALVEKRRNN